MFRYWDVKFFTVSVALETRMWLDPWIGGKIICTALGSTCERWFKIDMQGTENNTKRYNQGFVFSTLHIVHFCLVHLFIGAIWTFIHWNFFTIFNFSLTRMLSILQYKNLKTKMDRLQPIVTYVLFDDFY